MYKKLSDIVPETCNIKTSFIVQRLDIPPNILHHFTSLQKYIYVTSYVLRFINNLKKSTIKVNTNDNVNEKKVNEVDPSSLSVEECKVAFNYLIRVPQLEHFSKEYYALSSNKPILKNSRLISLNVALFEDNLVHVEGRLCSSNFSFDIKYPCCAFE